MTISRSSRNNSPITGGSGQTGDQPSAPSPGLLLFNSEELSDIVFIVGVDANTWRIPAHSFVVSGASRVFEEIIASRKIDNADYCNDKKPEVAVYCQPDVFHAMLSYVYKNDANLNSIVAALTLIPVAHRFEMHDLIRCCLSYLQQKACPENVLEILSFLRRYSAALTDSCNNYSQQKPESSTPPLLTPFYPSLENVMQGENLLNELIAKCYTILDSHADEILSRPDSIECLDHDLLVEVMNRDTLCLSSEAVAFECLVTWSCQQCLKQRMPVTGENRRSLLSEAVYSARYLIMSLEDFVKGPYTSDILSDEEKNYLLARHRGDVCDAPPKAVIGRKLDVPRKNPNRLLIPRSCDCKSKKRAAGDSNEPRKKSASKKLLNGLSGFMICVIQLLD